MLKKTTRFLITIHMFPVSVLMLPFCFGAIPKANEFFIAYLLIMALQLIAFALYKIIDWAFTLTP